MGLRHSTPACVRQAGRGPLAIVGVAVSRPGVRGTAYRTRLWRRGSRGRGHLVGGRGLGGWRVCIAGVLPSADLLAVHPERTAHQWARCLVPTGTLPRLGCRNGGRCRLVGVGGLLSGCRLVGVGGLLSGCRLVGVGDLLSGCRLVSLGGLLSGCRLGSTYLCSSAAGGGGEAGHPTQDPRRPPGHHRRGAVRAAHRGPRAGGGC
jgi:hypothetical protein